MHDEPWTLAFASRNEGGGPEHMHLKLNDDVASTVGQTTEAKILLPLFLLPLLELRPPKNTAREAFFVVPLGMHDEPWTLAFASKNAGGGPEHMYLKLNDDVVVLVGGGGGGGFGGVSECLRYLCVDLVVCNYLEVHASLLLLCPSNAPKRTPRYSSKGPQSLISVHTEQGGQLARAI